MDRDNRWSLYGERNMTMDRIPELLNRLNDLESDSPWPFSSGKTTPEHFMPGGEESSGVLFSFLTTDDNGGTANENPSLTMEPGDVHFGPRATSSETTAWADFTGESTTVTPTASNTAWYVWLVIDVESLAVTWKEGATITALTDEEKLTKINWPLVKVTLTWSEGGLGTVTAVKHLQCGDVMVSRAAG